VLRRIHFAVAAKWPFERIDFRAVQYRTDCRIRLVVELVWNL